MPSIILIFIDDKVKCGIINKYFKNMIIRTIDGGGSGFRRADINTGDLAPYNFVATDKPLCDIESIINFVGQDILPGTAGIAISLAGLIENNDLVVKSPNMKFLDGVNLAKIISDKINLKTLIFNDAESSAVGILSLLKNENYFLCITWGTGIGLRICYNNKILSNSEGGHMKLNFMPSAFLCNCGKRGCVEASIGGIYIKKKLQKKIKELDSSYKGDPFEFLNKDFSKRKKWAVDFYKEIARDMGLFLSNIQNLLCVPLIVWRGKVAIESLKFLEDDIRKTMEKHVFNSEWADKKYLRFQISPDPQLDCMIGSAINFKNI